MRFLGAKYAKKHLRPGLCPRPRWGAYSSPMTSWILGGLLLCRGEGKGAGLNFNTETHNLHGMQHRIHAVADRQLQQTKALIYTRKKRDMYNVCEAALTISCFGLSS